MTEENKEEKVEGYFVAEIPTNIERVIAIDGKQADVLELVTRIANGLTKAGINY